MGNSAERFIADLLAGVVTVRPEEARLHLNTLFEGPIPALAGVVGWPLAHTLSPNLHNYWCARHKVDGLYMRLPLSPERFDAGIAILRDLGFKGVNVTIPHKEKAFKCVTSMTESASRCGSVNTLVFHRDGVIAGDSTDGPGFCENLVASGVNLTGRAMVLGAGGAARAICASLRARGCQVQVSNRTHARAIALSDDIPGVDAVTWDAWPKALPTCQLLINTTSLGMVGGPVCDWAHVLEHAPKNLTICDIVYVPLETALLKAARLRGLGTVDGLGMLIEQARVGFKAWFGVDPSSDRATRAILLQALS